MILSQKGATIKATLPTHCWRLANLPIGVQEKLPLQCHYLCTQLSSVKHKPFPFHSRSCFKVLSITACQDGIVLLLWRPLHWKAQQVIFWQFFFNDHPTRHSEDHVRVQHPGTTCSQNHSRTALDAASHWPWTRGTTQWGSAEAVSVERKYPWSHPHPLSTTFQTAKMREKLRRMRKNWIFMVPNMTLKILSTHVCFGI